MVRRSRHSDAEARIPLEQVDNVGNILLAGKNVLKALIREPITDTLRRQLRNLLVVGKTNVIVLEQVFPATNQQGTDITSSVLNHPDIEVIWELLAVFTHSFRVGFGANRNDDVTAFGHRLDVVECGLQQIHVINMNCKCYFLAFRQRNAQRLRQYIIKMQVLHQISDVHRAKRVLPDQVHVIVGVVPQIFI